MKIVSMICAAALMAPGVAAQTSAATKADVALLQGEWELVSAMSNGRQAPPEIIRDYRRSTHGDTTTMSMGNTLEAKGIVVLDVTRRPKMIEYRVFGGTRAAGTIELGIYEITRETLHVCVSKPGKLRPREFGTHEGDFRTCTVWKHPKP